MLATELTDSRVLGRRTRLGADARQRPHQLGRRAATDSTAPSRMPDGPSMPAIALGSGSSRGTLSSMTTNRKSTMIAPA